MKQSFHFEIFFPDEFMRSKHSEPTILNVAPRQLVRIRLSNGIIVNPGKELATIQIQNQPEIDWDANADVLYTLLMVDADATLESTRIHGNICHWLVVNIPRKRLTEGQTLIEYIKPKPAIGSGLHRYIFLIFQQNDMILEEKFLFKITNDGHICVKTLNDITKYNLGIPVAGNYFTARHA